MTRRTRTFVVCATDGIVKAYVALAAGSVFHTNSPGGFRRNMPDPVPVVVLARLAVCRSVQRQGIGRALLADAFERVLQASEQIGMGFVPSPPANPNTLFLRLSGMAPSVR